MAVEKIERLMNLVAFLSSAKKPMTLREIVTTIPGYPDVFNSARRAFERDKEELKDLNFDLVLENNPDGESGYIIRRETTFYNFELSAKQRNVLQYALEKFGPDESTSDNTLSKLGSLNPEIGLENIVALPIPESIDKIFEAVSEGKVIKFYYKGDQRSVEGKKIVAKNGFWYLIAFDLDKKAGRTFRIDRVAGLEIGSQIVSSHEFEPSKDEQFEDELVEIKVKVNSALIEKFCSDFNAVRIQGTDICVFTISRIDIFLTRYFEYSGFVSVIEPKSLSDEISARIEMAKRKLVGI